MLKIWNLVLIGLTYSLCLFGTFLTRSGSCTSVHAFTADRRCFGSIFLGYVLASAALFFALLFWRRAQLRSTEPARVGGVARGELRAQQLGVHGASSRSSSGARCSRCSRSGWRGTKILLGPAVLQQAGGRSPALFLLFLTGVGPLIAWRRASLASLRRQFVVPAGVGLVTAVVLAIALHGRIGAIPLVFWCARRLRVGTIAQEYGRAIRARMRSGRESVLQALATLLRKNQRRYGGYVVHLGVVFILIGIGGAAFNEERLENVEPGEHRCS